jgi:predicted esterase
MRLIAMTAMMLTAWSAGAAEVAPGSIVDRVECAADPAQSYALYLPSHYSTERDWPVLFAFDPGARGRIPVERYQAAAEQYGWIVAASNNSRNGSWQVSMGAAKAMLDDVTARFRINQKRMYTAGMSGGARVALAVALGTNLMAGVIASSAGYADAKPRKTVPFALFETAGTEDFNYLEMRRLDRELTSPHRLAIFEGPHVWLPPELATEALEWMEMQAMKSGLEARDEARIDRIFARRKAAVDMAPTDKDRHLALESMAAEFQGLRDTAQLSARAAALGRDKAVKDALKKDRLEEAQEQEETDRILDAEGRLRSAEQHSAALIELRERWKELSTRAKAETDTAERRIARRVTRGLSMGAAERVRDPQYRKILADFAPVRQREEPRPPASDRQ